MKFHLYHPRNPGLSITCIIPGKTDLIANRKFANIMIPSCRGSNFISSVTKNNLGKKPKVVIKYGVFVSCEICHFCHTETKLSIFVY